jgi:hypothetical protein
LADITCWTLIRDASGGDARAREEFARLYLPLVRSYLGARWSGRLPPEEVEDAVQEVFVDCLKEDGLLERARRGDRSGFRALLKVACRYVALRVEARRARSRDAGLGDSALEALTPVDEETLGLAFDRAWGQALLREAAARQAERAREKGPEARRRVELLELRFREGLPIRDVAARWGVDAAWLHHQYAQAGKEFERALREVIAFNNPGEPEAVERELRELLSVMGPT